MKRSEDPGGGHRRDPRRKKGATLFDACSIISNFLPWVAGVVLFLTLRSRFRTLWRAKPLKEDALLKASLVIPAHNEEHRLPGTLATYGKEMRQSFQEAFEIVVVANGCSDETIGIASSAAAGDPQIYVIEIEEAIGKGGAVLEGFRRAQGVAIAFADADGATAPRSLIRLFEELDRSDIVIGSRRMEGSLIIQPQPLLRRFCGLVFAMGARLLFGLPFRDTQCGAKALRREAARRLCGVISEARWTFDLDLLLCARQLGLKISEQPVVWSDKEGSCLRYVSTTSEVLRALWSMKRRQRSLEALPRPGALREADEKAAVRPGEVT